MLLSFGLLALFVGIIGIGFVGGRVHRSPTSVDGACARLELCDQDKADSNRHQCTQEGKTCDYFEVQYAGYCLPKDGVTKTCSEEEKPCYKMYYGKCECKQERREDGVSIDAKASLGKEVGLGGGKSEVHEAPVCQCEKDTKRDDNEGTEGEENIVQGNVRCDD